MTIVGAKGKSMDGDIESYTQEEVRAALLELTRSPVMMNRLHSYARGRVWRRRLRRSEATDLVHQAVMCSLDGKWRWRRDLTPIQAMNSIIRSLAFSYGEKEAREIPESSFSREGSTMETDVLSARSDSALGPDEILIRKQYLEQLFQVLPAGGQRHEVLTMRLNDASAEEIMAKLGLTETQFKSILTAIVRARGTLKTMDE